MNRSVNRSLIFIGLLLYVGCKNEDHLDEYTITAVSTHNDYLQLTIESPAAKIFAYGTLRKDKEGIDLFVRQKPEKIDSAFELKVRKRQNDFQVEIPWSKFDNKEEYEVWKEGIESVGSVSFPDGGPPFSKK